MAEAAASLPCRPNLLTPTCSATYVAALAQHAGQSGGGRPELWSTWADALLTQRRRFRCATPDEVTHQGES